MTSPIESRYTVNGVELTVFEWPGEGRPLFFAHATGFHARCWDETIRQLPGRHCMAVDMRGHGRSTKSPLPYSWLQFGRDVAELAAALRLRDAIGIGHSMGGHSVTYAAALQPGAFAGLLLLDPVILPKEAYAVPRGTEHFASRRRNEWASADEMFERFASRPPYDSWDRAVLRDYCDFGLLPNPSGEGFVLACPPEVEGNIYLMGGDGEIYGEIESLDIPARIVRARLRTEGDEGAFNASPTYPRLVEHFKRGSDVAYPEATHFFPMQQPGLVASELHALEREIPR